MTLFDFRNYGTFTGPGKGGYNYDDSEPNWHLRYDLDSLTRQFDLKDIGVLFFNNPKDYAYFHCFGTNTSIITLEKGTGNLQNLIANVTKTNFNGDITVNGNIIANENVVVNGRIFANGIVNSFRLNGIGDIVSYMQSTRTIANSKKSFDISHPTKEGYRLRYICLEGPSADVYIKGKLKDSNVIELPDYWSDLVDETTINVSLTPIGVYQELFVEKIESCTKIIIRNNLSGPIYCHYKIIAERKDTSKNISEYKGSSIHDYPGDNSEYAINTNSFLF